MKIINKLVKKIKENKRCCENCKRWHTFRCPNSYYCYDNITKPYFERRGKK